MAQSGYTPILIYGSGTTGNTPSAGNLTSSAAGAELALNYFDGRLFYKDNAGVVQILAVKMPSGVLPVANGGTGQSSYAAGDLLYATGATTLTKLTVGAASTILTSSGTAPQWSTASGITVGIATNLAGGVAGSLPYQTGANTTTFLGIGAANRVLTSTGSAPQWVTSLTSLTGVSSSSITNTSLTSGRVVYSTTGGAQTDSANLTFDGSTLTVNSVNVGRGGGAVSTNTAVGSGSMAATASSGNNVAVGQDSGANITSSTGGTGIGWSALKGPVGGVTGNYNTGIGWSALTAVSSGANNTAVGASALIANTTASGNTAVGFQAAGSNTTGGSNTAIGAAALTANTTASGNTAVGASALFTNSTGVENTAVGGRALRLNTTGNYNTAMGGNSGVGIQWFAALEFNTTGSNNSAFGDGALAANTTGNQNTAVGAAAIYTGTTVSNNTAVGYRALYNATVNDNVAVGHQAGFGNTTGLSNIYLGVGAGSGVTTGNFNIIVGSNGSGFAAMTGSKNVIMGHKAGASVTSGFANLFIGPSESGVDFGCGQSMTTGGVNIAFGAGAMAAIQTASSNIAIGNSAMLGSSSTTGSNNVTIGNFSGYSLTTGSRNTFIGSGGAGGAGFFSGYFVTTGSANTVLGAYNGNQGGLDIRTSSNNIVLSDGDGNPRLYINSSGSVGLDTPSPSYLLSLGGNSARTVGMERHTTSNTAGNNLTLLAGGATSGATDKNGGTLALSSGTATGSGSSIMTFLTTTAGAAGTADRSPTEKMRLDGTGRLSINTVSPIAAALVTVAANASASGNGFRSITTIADATSGVTQTGNGAPLIINTSGLNASQNVTALAINSQGFANGSHGQHLELNNLSTLSVNDRLGSILFGGNDGSTIRSGAAIQSFVDSAVSVGNVPARLIFATNGTERMRLPGAGGVQAVTTISVGNATPAASGAGITFPATQSASSDANTLDDYEEGDWTPTQGAGITLVGSFSSLGKYTKIGRLVYAYGYVAGSTSVALAAAGTVICAGLPFAAPAAEGQMGTMGNNATTASGAVQVTSSTIYNNDTMAATTKIFFSVTYYV